MFVALSIEQAKFMRHILLLSVACLALPYVSTLIYKCVIFERKLLLNTICVLIVSITFV